MSDKTINRYNELIDLCPRFERKGKTMPYTSANGHMFSFINKSGELGIRFAKEIQEKYFLKYKTGHLHSHGAVMKGYVLIPPKLLKNENEMLSLLNESFDYVMSLKPK